MKIGIRAGCGEAVGVVHMCARLMSGSKVKVGRIQLFVADGEVLKI